MEIPFGAKKHFETSSLNPSSAMYEQSDILVLSQIRAILTLKRYDRFFPKLPLRVTQQKGNKDIKSLNAHNSVTIGPTELADPSLESSFHALSDGQYVVSG